MRCAPVAVDHLYGLEPRLGDGVVDGLLVPGEAIVDPWSPVVAFATEAVRRGAAILRNTPVIGIEPGSIAGTSRYVLRTPSASVATELLVNAAGLRSDELDAQLGARRFTVTPRRGELIVFDKLARPLLRHILLPVPTAVSKGVLVAPTVFGNVVLGPTAEDREDKDDTSTSGAGLETLMAHGRRILPALADEEVTAAYAGPRAATEEADYRISIDARRGYACAGGIRSTGLTSALAVAEHVVRSWRAGGVPLEPDSADADEAMAPEFAIPARPHLGETSLRPYADAGRVAADQAFGRIVCHCERVTEGEIRAACTSDLPPADLDGLRRRTRALMGRCQGFYCTAAVVTMMASCTGRAPAELLGVQA